MEIENFIEKFAGQFDETPVSLFTPETEFKKLDEWSSLIALSVIAMVDEEFNVGIGAKEIMGSDKIADLFNIIIAKVG